MDVCKALERVGTICAKQGHPVERWMLNTIEEFGAHLVPFDTLLTGNSKDLVPLELRRTGRGLVQWLAAFGSDWGCAVYNIVGAYLYIVEKYERTDVLSQTDTEAARLVMVTIVQLLIGQGGMKCVEDIPAWVERLMACRT